MTITTPSGYKVTFKEESELNYGERRTIQRALVGNVKIDAKTAKNAEFDLTGGMVYDSQDVTLRVILKSIVRPDGTQVDGDLYEEVMSWTNQEDGDAVFEIVNQNMASGNTKKKTTK